MKKLAAILMALALTLSLAACGGEKEKTPETTSASAAIATEATEAETEGTTAAPEVSLVAIGDNCTVTVPKLETFFDGYKGARVDYKNPSPNTTVYVNLYRDDPKLEVNVSVGQLALSSAQEQSAKGYADYYNEISKMYHYDPIEIAGFSGYIATKKSSGSTDNNYFIDYTLSDGSSVVITLHVAQKYADDTSEMASIAEAFLKNIVVAPVNA